jgi:hypothetical protein
MERPCTWVCHEFTYVFPHELLDWLAQRSNNPSTSQRDASHNADNLTRMPQRSNVSPQPARASHMSAQQVPTSSTQAAHVAQTTRRGLGLHSGQESWLNLEQVASIIQYHNNGRNHRIVTTLLQGVERADWETVWTHMQRAESVAMGEIETPTARVRDHLTRYGQLLCQHKQDNISGVCPMQKFGHWRMMIVTESPSYACHLSGSSWERFYRAGD